MAVEPKNALLFRKMLKQIAVFDKRGKTWVLKDSFSE